MKTIRINYFFPKYIKAKNESVLTIAIKYQPDVELLEISVTGYVEFAGDFNILEEIICITNRTNKFILWIFIYIKILTMRKIAPITTDIIAPSTNKSFHV